MHCRRAAYNEDVWWFEGARTCCYAVLSLHASQPSLSCLRAAIDMLHKLILTSMLAFFPTAAQV
jgi:hypothetical protein